ncbi:MAG: RagB/SusD family nutrient uptake outer membrane protein [Bacteroidaceae bacterium]|nr:RagB/SusD family nutrient uptake outer membrane protein [Bacteroidaceae bacterium]
MKKNIIRIPAIFMSALLVLTATSCSDMLSVDSGDKIEYNANDTLYSYLGILKSMQELAERQVLLGELRGDLVTTTDYVTDTLYAIANFDDPKDGSCSLLQLSDYYAVINNCNLYLSNADTAAIKSNIKYMVPEYAQVSAIRAWTYLQLVQNYGSVPFITRPINSLGVVRDFDYNANQANKDNLIDLILETGIADLAETRYPQYGSFNNGAVSIASRKLMIPIYLVLADMYLLRGASQADYVNAAKLYYQWLKVNAPQVTIQYCSATQSRVRSGKENEELYSYSPFGAWGEWASRYSYSAADDEITIIPSSANKQFGTMLMRVADVYGYTPTSRQNSSTTTNADGEEETSTSGAISVSRNWKTQTTPSNAYFTLSRNQTYVFYDNSTTNPTRMEYESGDARYGCSTEDFTYESEAYRLCSKAAKGSNFYYSIPIYRKTQIWLRLAEAINRAGFPQMAFAILKDGITEENMPKQSFNYNTHMIIDELTGDTLRNDTGGIVYVTDTIPYLKLNDAGAMYYVDSTEVADFFLDFSDDAWIGNYGIHSRGSGFGNWASTSDITRRTNLTGYNDSIVFDYDSAIVVKLSQKYPGQTFAKKQFTKEQAIDAVEDLIIDEMGLELAFEGYRFTDLVRVANHKNAAGQNGTNWLADKIANRNVKAGKYNTSSLPPAPRDESLYTKLLNQSAWYFTKPTWSF